MTTGHMRTVRVLRGCHPAGVTADIFRVQYGDAVWYTAHVNGGPTHDKVSTEEAAKRSVRDTAFPYTYGKPGRWKWERVEQEAGRA